MHNGHDVDNTDVWIITGAPLSITQGLAMALSIRGVKFLIDVRPILLNVDGLMKKECYRQ